MSGQFYKTTSIGHGTCDNEPPNSGGGGSDMDVLYLTGVTEN